MSTNSQARALGDGRDGDAIDRVEILISRIAGGGASAACIEEFSVLAASRPGAWRDLAAAQQDQAGLCASVNALLDAADRVELPGVSAAEAFLGRPPARVQPLKRMGLWAGWAAAAAVALTWTWTVVQPKSPQVAPATAGMLNPDAFTLKSPDDALNAYLQLGAKKGTVMGELPNRVVLDSRPNPAGKGFEVTYLRQFVEKGVVQDVVRFGQDDAGKPIPVRMMTPAAPAAAQ